MKTLKTENAAHGEMTLPATFTTGYKRDLAVAREIIRTRQGRTQPASHEEKVELPPARLVECPAE